MCPPSSTPHLNPTTTTAPDPNPNPTLQSIQTLIPTTPIAQSAFTLASTLLPPAILHHSLRVYLYAKSLAQKTNSPFLTDQTKHSLLFTACILHDIGTTPTYDGPERFEIEGADAAAALLISHGYPADQAHEAWVAIALHTSPGIAEKIGEVACLVRRGVLVDFGRAGEVEVEVEGLEELRGKLESRFPRLGIEKVLGDAVVEQAVRRPGKAVGASWANNLYRAYLADPAWMGVNRGF